MVIQEWILWLAVAAALAIGEILTAGFFLAWFAIGAAVACVGALFGLGTAEQWALFIGVSGVLVLFSRRIADRFTRLQPPGIGADRYIGQIGVVLEEIDNLRNTGRVRIGKDEWRADSGTDETIPEGIWVKVTGLEGTHLVVVPLQEVK